MSSPSNTVAQIAGLLHPKLSQSVHREECTQCFDSQDSLEGIDVCLHCFNGGCLGAERHHARDHSRKTGHRFALNVRRKLKPSTRRAGDEEPPAKMTKLAIAEEREEDMYEHETAVRDWDVDALVPGATDEPAVRALVDAVMAAMSSGKQSEVQAWEEEIVACEHTLTLQQQPTAPIAESGLAHCQKCDLKENLWLCLACGSLGCGRKQIGGLDGNGHALAHYNETRHPVAVKLGTITPEGGADIYCYACDESRTDPELPFHLAHFGISVGTQRKTAKSMTELQIEQNMSLEFSFALTDDSGRPFEPLSGPGRTGLANLGNSCYIASVMQALLALPAFRARYLAAAPTHWAACTVPRPAECVDCQMHKLADGLLSGRYAVPHAGEGGGEGVWQRGLRPATFKALIGRGHAEFATMRQQDAEEFLAHLLTVLRRDAHRTSLPDATRVFAFALEQRLQCRTCMGVRYKNDVQDAFSVPVPAREKGKDEDGKTVYEEVRIEECVALACGTEELAYRCPRCSTDVQASKQMRFATTPDVLVVHAKKFQLVNWVPTKLLIPLAFPEDDVLALDAFVGIGLQEGETELPDDAPGPQVDVDALQQLEAMGFPTVRCQRALLATGDAGAEAAMEWLFAHMDDPDIDAPIQAPGAQAPEPSAEQVELLAAMGFTPTQARKALRETAGNAERAVEWLFSHPDDTGEDTAAPPSSAKEKELPGSRTLPARFRLKAFVSHKGPSVHSGHYVAHVRDGEDWVFFNDEKVVRADAESVRALKGLAYLYFFERI
ncbi:ubiquitinyl hydrolase [Vararia minispora EC-137]|uniref:Ubiquitinyl hydrolase n=1 Tax=Vararia minispora EC-137 TaxID=1314806 RepID=A0ACB8QLA5_9AGAM|nr:ubiquitinyl hydrolase [Vararia minispora EC-137]